MKRIFPNLSNLFASWATAGQYSSVEEMEIADEAAPTATATANKVHVLPTSSRRVTASTASNAAKPIRKKLG